VTHVRWLALLVAACGAATPPPTSPTTGITYRRPPAPPADPARDHAHANQILVAYGNEHALGVARRIPTSAELAAAANADPFDGASEDEWRRMDPPMRMLRAYEAGQHVAWDAVCKPAVESWWYAASSIDHELATRLAQPVPTDLYAGLAVWSQHRSWLAQRTKSDPAFAALPMSSTGAYHRLAAAQIAWADAWRDRPVAHALAVAAIREDGWPLDALAEEQTRFCTATWLHTSRVWPPVLYSPIRIQQPRNPSLPASEYGVVAKVDATGEELRVTRRDRETTIETVPPCKRVRCTGLDCEMDARHGWRDICVEKQVHRIVNHAWTLHVVAPPVVPKAGDQVTFYFDAATGDAVLATAAKTERGDAYFTLPIY
jgi:hypothetical protein